MYQAIDVSSTNVGLILTKLCFFFLGGQTDMILESSHGNMSAHKKKFQLNAQN